MDFIMLAVQVAMGWMMLVVLQRAVQRLDCFRRRRERSTFACSTAKRQLCHWGSGGVKTGPKTRRKFDMPPAFGPVASNMLIQGAEERTHARPWRGHYRPVAAAPRGLRGKRRALRGTEPHLMAAAAGAGGGDGEIAVQALQTGLLVSGVADVEVLGWLANDWAPSLPRRREMPVGAVPQAWGIELVYEASPTDSLAVTVHATEPASAGCVVAVMRGGEGRGAAGALGPHVASLIRAAERDISSRLDHALRARFPSTTPIELAPAGNDRENGTTDESDRENVSPSSPPSQLTGAMVEDDREEGRRDVSSVLDLVPHGEDDRFDEVDGGLGTIKAENIDDAAARELVEALQSDASDAELARAAGFESSDDTGLPNGFAAAVDKFVAETSLSEAEIDAMFATGAALSASSSSSAMATDGGALDSTVERIDDDLVQLRLQLGGKLQGGSDLLAGPPRAVRGSAAAAASERIIAAAVDDLEKNGGDASAMGGTGLPDGQTRTVELSPEMQAEMDRVERSLRLMVRELRGAPADMFYQIMAAYRDVVLSSMYPAAAREILASYGEGSSAGWEVDASRSISSTDDDSEAVAVREVLGRINDYAVTCMEELAAMTQAAEQQQLEKIQQICETALDDMGRLPEVVKTMKPLLDADFVAYLNYAIEKERTGLTRRGMDPDREPSQWLQVLGVVQQGVYAELGKAVRQDVEALTHVLKMPDAETRRLLLQKTIDTLPTWDIREFHRVATNVVANIADGFASGRVDATLAAKVQQMGRDLEDLLPADRVDELAADADAAKARLERGMYGGEVLAGLKTAPEGQQGDRAYPLPAIDANEDEKWSTADDEVPLPGSSLGWNKASAAVDAVTIDGVDKGDAADADSSSWWP